MKSVFLATLFFGLAANACPDLTGTFLHDSQNQAEKYTLTLTQSESEGITTYNVTVASTDGQSETGSAIADGIERSTVQKDAEGEYKMSDTFTCSQNALVNNFAGVYTSNQGQILYNLKGIASYSINADNNLSTIVEGDENGETFKSEEVLVRQ